MSQLNPNKPKSILPIDLQSNGAASLYYEIVQIGTEICDYLNQQEGMKVRACAKNPLLERFLSLTEEEQKAIHEAAKIYYQTFFATIQIGKSPRSNKDAVRVHLQSSRSRIDKDVLDTIDSHQCVEIYNRRFLQIYRSPNFLDYVDHSYEELSILPYYDIFTRSIDVNQTIMLNAIAILQGDTGANWNFVEDNIVKEVGSARATRLHTVVCGPVYSNETNEIIGLIHIFDIQNQSSLQLLN